MRLLLPNELVDLVFGSRAARARLGFIRLPQEVVNAARCRAFDARALRRHGATDGMAADKRRARAERQRRRLADAFAQWFPLDRVLGGMSAGAAPNSISMESEIACLNGRKAGAAPKAVPTAPEIPVSMIARSTALSWSRPSCRALR